MSKLSQVIAVEKNIKSRVNTTVTELYKSAQHPALFEGFNKKYKPLEEGAEVFPNESKKVQLSSKDVLTKTTAALVELLDVTATKDFANCSASADVVVDGVTLVEKAPVSYLLFLEKQLTDLHTLVATLPTLDPAEDWTLDANANLFKTDATTTTRTKKVQKPVVLYPATTEHPAQTQLITEDITVGNWELVKFSGALPVPQKEALLAKLEKLQKAVKFAREDANGANATEQLVGAKLLGWLTA